MSRQSQARPAATAWSPRLDPVTLRLFRAAVEGRSLAQAAERENITLSAASRRIADLEARLGTPLLHRHDRGVVMAAAGEVLMTHLGTLFNLLDRIWADLDAFATGERGYVRLQANMSAVSGLLPEALAGFTPVHPGIRLILEERYSEKIVHQVQTGTADIGLISGTIQAPGLHLLPWREDRLMVVLPEGHDMTREDALTLSGLDGISFVGQAPEAASQILFRKQAAIIGMTLRECVNISGFDGVRRMVEAGLGVAILPSTAALPYAGLTRITVRPLDEEWARRPLVLCTRDPATLSAATRILVSHLVGTVPVQPSPEMTTAQGRTGDGTTCSE